MASSWVTKQSSKPVSFQQLARLIRDGKLKEHDLVRRANSEHWEVVESVVGLLHTAYRNRDADRKSQLKREVRRVAEEQSAARRQQEEADAAEHRMRVNSGIKLVFGKIMPIALGLVIVVGAWRAATYDPMDNRSFESDQRPAEAPQESPDEDLE